MNNICENELINKECLLNQLSTIANLPIGIEYRLSALPEDCSIDSLISVALLLKAFGAIELSEQHIKLKSYTSKMLIQSLSEYIDNDIDVFTGWNDKKGKPIEITEKNCLISEVFLYLLERRRVNLLGTSANPLRKNDIVRVIFKAHINGKDNYLMQYDAVAKQYQLIGGYIDDTDFNATAAAIREVSEELPEADFEINHNYKLREVYKAKQVENFLSSTYCVYSSYEVTAFFAYDVEYGIIDKINSKHNAWISLEEIQKGKARDGRKVFRVSQEMQDVMRTSEKSIKRSKFLFSKFLNDRRLKVLGLLIAIVGLIFTILAFFKK